MSNFTNDDEARLDGLFRAYRDACPDPEPGVNFMPDMWARIDARRESTHIFGRMARMLVTAALAASAIIGMMIATSRPPGVTVSSMSYMQALAADHVSDVDALQVERLSELEQ